MQRRQAVRDGPLYDGWPGFVCTIGGALAEPEPSAKVGADSTAKTAETVGWKVADAGS
jgi:hypothetical protein